MAKPLIRYVCGNCDDEGVGYDARTEWDEHAQDFVLGQGFDSAWCPNCGEDADPQEVRLSSREAAELRRDIAKARADSPAGRGAAFLAEADAVLAEVLERLTLNDCEGEEAPYRGLVRRLRAKGRRLRAELRKAA